MAKLNVISDMSEQLEYGTPALPIRSMVTDLAQFARQTTDCHWHDDLEFVLVLKGAMHYFVEDRQYLLTSGMGIFVNSGRLHYGKAVGKEGCRHSFLIIGLPLLRKHDYLEKKYIQPLLGEEGADAIVFTSEIDWQQEALHHIKQCIDLFANRQEGYELLMSSLLDRMILLLHQHMPASQRKSDNLSGDGAIKRMIGFIEKNCGEKLTLADIAASGAVCRSRCCQLFQSVLKMTPIEYMTDYRLKKSCELLQEQRLSVAEVAQICGFGSSSYFGSLFRKKYGVTPRQYQLGNNDG